MATPIVNAGAAAGTKAPLPRTVILLGWVSFFADVSGEMIYPLLPLFIVGVLQASATSLGWVEGLTQAAVALMTAWAGWRSDRGRGGVRRRVPYIRWGYGLPVVGKAVLSAATTWPMVLGGRMIDRVGKGIRGSPRDALIADSAEESQRGRAFGLHRAMDTAGAMVGVLLAAGLLWWLGDSAAAPASTGAAAGDGGRAFRIVFAISAAMGLAALILTFLVKEAPHAATGDEPGARRAAGGVDATGRRGVLGLPRRYWMVLVMLVMFALANSSDTFLLLRARDLGMRAWVVVLAYAMYNLTYTLGSYPAGVLSDRIGRWRVIGIGWGIYGAVYAGFAVTGAVGVWPLLAVYGLYMALTDGVGKALITDVAPNELRGQAIGVFFMVNGLTTLTSSVAAGALWDRVGHTAPFVLGAAAAGVAVVMMLVVAWVGRGRAGE